MYDIEKMKTEKQHQMERREKIRKIVNRIIVYPIDIAVLKAASVLYLVLLQPYVYQMTENDLDGSQINTIISIICTLILFIKRKDMEE
jgi:hypothetical protein